jgi:hypothetical protein
MKKADLERKTITEVISNGDYNVYACDFNGMCIDDIIIHLNDVKNKYDTKYSKIMLNIPYDTHDSYDSYDPYYAGIRLENDDEYNKRIEKIKYREKLKKEAKKNKQEAERAEYERLKKIYG